MKVIFMGTPQFAVKPLEALSTHGFELAAVYTRPDKPSGRGRKVAYSPVKQAALDLGLNVEQPLSLKKEEEVKKLREYETDVIVVAAYGQILTQEVLDIPRYGCINIHPSILPRHRGAAPVASAILAGDRETAVSIMLMTAGLDSGPVIALSEKVPICDEDNTETLMERLSEIAAGMLPDAVEGYVKGNLIPKPQDDEKATYFKMMKKEEGLIDWDESAVSIWRKVRAFNPWPGAFTFWCGKKIKITKAEPLSAEGQNTSQDAEVGYVFNLEGSKKTIAVKTGEGILKVEALQLEGKKEMPAAAFLQGNSSIIGEVLG